MSVTTKPVNQKAWFLILPVILCVAFSAILPLMTVVNYSVQDIISPERRVFVGTEWFVQIMRDEELHAALLRQITFSLAVLAVEIPLGILLALSMPAQGWKSSAVLVTVALSLLIPWNVVGTIWQIYGRADIGLMGRLLQEMGIDYSYTGNATADISLSTPDPLADYELDTPTSASIVVQNDDLPTVSIACTPATLVDSAGQESVCTISSNVPAPVGGMTVGLAPFAANPRYATTCGASVVLAEGTSSSTCTVTATANTVPGDGSVTGSIALQANAAAYNLGTPSSADVVVNDDDSVTPPGGNGDPIGVPVGGWPAGLGLAALAWAQLRKRRQTAQTD